MTPVEMLLRVQDLLHQENLPAAKPLVEELVTRLSASTAAAVTVVARIIRADYLIRQRDFEAARAAVGDARRAAQNEPALIAPALVQFAAIDMRAGLLQDAEELLRDALRLAEQVGDVSCAADAAFNLGTLEAQRSWDAAIPLWEKALEGYRARGRTSRAGDCLHHLGVAHRALERDEQALPLLEESLVMALSSADYAAIERRAGDLARTHYCMFLDGHADALRSARAALQHMLAAGERTWGRAEAAEQSVGARIERAVQSFNNIETAMLVALAEDAPVDFLAASALAKGRMLRGDYEDRSRAEVEAFRDRHPGFAALSFDALTVNASFFALAALETTTEPIAFLDCFGVSSERLLLTLHVAGGDPETVSGASPWPHRGGRIESARLLWGEGQATLARDAARLLLTELEKYSARAGFLFDPNTGRADAEQRRTMIADELCIRELLEALGSFHFPLDVLQTLKERRVRHVFLSPDPRLFSLPWAALVLPDGTSILDQPWTVSLIPSVTSLYDIIRRRRAASNRRLRFLAPDDNVMAHLGGEDELRGIEERFTPEVIRGSGATLDALRGSLKHGWVHIRSHGTFARGMYVPKLSDGPWCDPVVDGSSTGAVLVAVACRSGETKAAGQDVFGMFDMAERSDVRATLAPVVSVDGIASRFFLAALYRELARGATLARALQHAMRETRNDLPHPAFWAPFVLAGDPDCTGPATSS